MKTLTTEEALGLLSEEIVDGAQGVGFCYHALLAILSEMDDDDRHIVIPVDVLVEACQHRQISIRFLPEDQKFVLGTSGPADPSGPLCAFGWSAEDSQA